MESVFINHYYGIAGLQLALRFPASVDIDKVLPSFSDFRLQDPKEKSTAVVRFDDQGVLPEDCLGTLRSDISLVWGDNFRLYEQEDDFIIWIKHAVKDKEWMMRSTKDFKESTIFGNPKDPRIGELISWLLMVVFGQVGLQHQLILIHASVIAYGQTQGGAFLGKSGTGKSTHSKLWLQHIPDTELLNDDNPAVRIEANGKVMVYGTPWSGKTPCYKNKKVELKGLVRLQQAPVNRFSWKKGAESLVTVLPSCTAIRWNKTLFNAMTGTLTGIATSVGVGYLECLPNADAAKMSYEAVFGE